MSCWRPASCRSRHGHCSRAREGKRRGTPESSGMCSSCARPITSPIRRRTQELAYLANAIVAGCSLQARPFTAQEASDAAVATCNLGLENWPPHWLPPASRLALPDDFLRSGPRPRRRLPGRVDRAPRAGLHVCGGTSRQRSSPTSGVTTTRSRPGWTRFERRWRRSGEAGAPWACSRRAGRHHGPGHAGVGRAARAD